MEPSGLKAVPVREDGMIALNLATFNILYEDPGIQPERQWQNRLPSVVRTIRSMKPDVFGAQEALHGQAADLRASLPDFSFYGVGRDDGDRAGEYAAIFYGTDRFQADESDAGTFWLSATPEIPGSRTWGNQYPRIAVWIRLIDRATGRGFYVFHTHWDQTKAGQNSREQGALLIARRIDARHHQDEPVVLLGDFNSLENNPAFAYLTGQSATVAGTKQQWPNGFTDTLWSGSRAGSRMVDHILVPKNAMIEASAIVTGEEPLPSDHFPVMARVLIP
jgi:endonuclease/exonuclease/phosphatase family metal-dependent hydrolase